MPPRVLHLVVRERDGECAGNHGSSPFHLSLPFIGFVLILFFLKHLVWGDMKNNYADRMILRSLRWILLIAFFFLIRRRSPLVK